MIRSAFVVSVGVVLSTSVGWSFSRNAAPKISQGHPFDQVVEQQKDGLDFDLQKEKLMGFVAGLGGASSRSQAMAQIMTQCLKSEYADMCAQVFEDAKARVPANSKQVIPKLTLTAKDLSKWSQLNLQAATKALGRYRGSQLLSFANIIAEQKTCQSTSLYTALGAHLEDGFPEQKYVDAVMTAYQRAGECGTDESAMRAKYRLGLMQVWKGNCEEGAKTLRSMPQDNKIAWIDARARYWATTCSKDKRQPTSVDAKEKVLEKFSLYPMSFHSIVFSIEKEDDLFKKVQTQKEPMVLFRSNDHRANVLVGLTEAALRAEKEEHAKFLMSLLPPEKTAGEESGFRLYTGFLYHRCMMPLSKFQLFSDLFSRDLTNKTMTSLRLMYPLWKYEIVDKATKELDPLLVLALIRQESAFQENATSRVGARGLMQIMPRTANSLHGKRLKPNKLYDAELNVNLGTKYVDRLLSRYDGNVFKVLAAYNAGALRVDEWSKRYPTENNILFMDMIPYKETRDYVAAILRNYYWYSRLYPELSKKQFAFWSSAQALHPDREPASVAK